MRLDVSLKQEMKMRQSIALVLLMLLVSVCARGLQTQIITQDSFEGVHGWTLSGDFAIGSSGEGIPARTGTNILATNLNGNHSAGVALLDYAAISPEYNLSGHSNLSFNFWSWSNFEGGVFDRGSVYISINNTAWQAVYTPSYLRETAWTKHWIPLPVSADNAASIRVMFTYASDYAEEHSGWNIDDVTLQASSPLGGIYTIDPTSSQTNNFSSFGQAIEAINIAGIGSSTTFNVASGSVFHEELPTLIQGGNQTAALSFTKSGTGANPRIISTGNASLRNAVLHLQGVSYLSFDSIDLQGSGDQIEYGIYLQNRSGFVACNHNSFSNLQISQISSINILAELDYEPLALSGAHSHNSFESIVFNGGGAGLALESRWFTDTDYYGSGNSVQYCLFGTSSENALSNFAIKLEKQAMASLAHNIIQHISSNSTTHGIIHKNSFEGIIHSNRISGLSGSNCTAMELAGAKVYNNFINLSQAGVGLSSLFGVRILNQGGTYIDFNSIRIEAGNYTSSSCVITPEARSFRLTNNILANLSFTASQGHRHTLIESPYANALEGLGSISNANLFYNPQNPNSIAYDMNHGLVLGFLSWQGHSQMDSFSRTGDPKFVSAIDLHINPTLPTPVESNGRFLFQQDYSWITTDIDGDLRNVNTLDIGADEGDFVLDIQPPFTPYPISPMPNAQNVFINQSPTLSWSLGMDNMHPIDFSELYFSNDVDLVNQYDASVMVQGDGQSFYDSWTAQSTLYPGTTYYWRVVLYNGVGNSSGGLWSFTTETVIDIYPHTQGFEDADLGGWVNRWSAIPGADELYPEMGSGWQQTSIPQYVQEGTSAIYINSMMMPAYYWLISPLYEIPSEAELSFWMYYEHTDMEPTELQVWAQIDGTWQIIRDYNDSLQNNLYTAPELISLADYSGERVRFAFVYNSGAWGNPVAIDNVSIQLLEGFSLGIGQNQDGNIVLTWNAVSGAIGYTIKEADNPAGPFSNLITLPAETISFTIPLLHPRKFYYVVPLR